MQKLYLALAALLGSTGLGQAQTFQAGIRGGANWATYAAPREPYTANQSTAPHAQLGVVGGIFANYQLSSRLSVQPELLYSRKGTAFSTRYSGGSGVSSFNTLDQHRIKLDYLELPLLVQVGGKRLFGQLGPQVGVLLGTRNELFSQTAATYSGNSSSRSTVYGTHGFERWQCDAVAGVGYRFFEQLALTARYSYGLTHVLRQPVKEKPSDPTPIRYTEQELGRNQTLQLSLSYTLLGGQP